MGQSFAAKKGRSAANPYWGAPRIHGELLKLGIEISERTVSLSFAKTRSASQGASGPLLTMLTLGC